MESPSQEEGVQHLICSTLLNITHLTSGKFPNVYHFDSKAAIEAHVREIGLPATFFHPGFYMSNLPGASIRPMPPSNAWTMALPMPADTPIPLFDAAGDTGKFVKAILMRREQLLGKQVRASTAYYTPVEVMDIFKELYPKAGKEASFVQNSEEAFKGVLAGMGMPPKAQTELYENMAFMHEFGYYGKGGLEESLAVSFRIYHLPWKWGLEADLS